MGNSSSRRTSGTNTPPPGSTKSTAGSCGGTGSGATSGTSTPSSTGATAGTNTPPPPEVPSAGQTPPSGFQTPRRSSVSTVYPHDSATFHGVNGRPAGGFNGLGRFVIPPDIPYASSSTS